MDAVHGNRVVAAVGGEHKVAARVDRHAAAPVSQASWLSLRQLALRRPLSAPGHARGCPKVASANLGQSVAWAALAARLYRPWSRHGAARVELAREG
jgi:hypothetical protein